MRFRPPHNSTHVVSGYDTTAPGEVLVSTFTAAMHRKWPMAGHISRYLQWHLGIKINDVAKTDPPPETFWRAWRRGGGRYRLFDPGWFSGPGPASLAALRRHGVTPYEPHISSVIRRKPGSGARYLVEGLVRFRQGNDREKPRQPCRGMVLRAARPRAPPDLPGGFDLSRVCSRPGSPRQSVPALGLERVKRPRVLRPERTGRSLAVQKERRIVPASIAPREYRV